jgi:hypothetical protein
MDPYELDRAAQLDYSVTVGGVPTDASVTLTITKPDGTSSTPVITHPSTGNYRAAVLLDQVGTWRFKWRATGAATTAESGYFVVRDLLAELPLAEVADVERTLSTTFEDPDRQQIEQALRGLSRRVRNYTRQTITKATTTEIGYCYAENMIVLSQRPVISVAGVTVDGVAQTLGTQYRIEDGVLFSAYRSGWGSVSTPAVVAITYTHGYDPVPEDLVDLVVQRIVGRLSNPEGVRQLSVGSFSATFSAESISGTGWNAEELDVLRSYRIRPRYGSVRMVTT